MPNKTPRIPAPLSWRVWSSMLCMRMKFYAIDVSWVFKSPEFTVYVYFSLFMQELTRLLLVNSMN